MSVPGGECVGVRMHGVRLNLRCDHEPQLRYTAELLGAHVCEPWERPDIEVASTWRVGSKSEEPELTFDVSELDAYGKRMYLGPDEVVWSDTFRDKDLQLRFRRQGALLRCDVAYRYLPSTKKLAKYEDYEQKKFFDLLRYLVFFPISWHLRRTRGWELIHASAVASESGAVLIAGPGGGVSTTLRSPPGRACAPTENLVFCDAGTCPRAADPPHGGQLRLLGSRRAS
jgi:hypothetical protein